MLEIAVITLLVAALASCAQAVTGFGFALLAIPLLSLVTDVQTAVVGVTLLSGVLTTGVTISSKEHIKWPLVGIITLAALCGIPLGVVAMQHMSDRHLSLAVACLVIIFAMLSLRTSTLRRSGNTAMVSGFLSGLFLTATGLNGPPLVAALRQLDLSKTEFRATLQANFAAQDALAIGGFAIAGMLSLEVLVLGVTGLIGMPMGWKLGSLIFDKLPPQYFRLIIFVTLLLSALVLILQAI